MEDKKRTNRIQKNKVKKRNILILFFLIVCVIVVAIIIATKSVNVGKINKDGKAEYIERIANVTKYENRTIIEFKNDYELIDNGIITTEMYEKMKNNDNIYNLTLKEYLRLGDLSAKESYNINKAIQTGVVNEETLYADYFAKTCGFKDKKELLKYTKAVFKLANKER